MDANCFMVRQYRQRSEWSSGRCEWRTGGFLASDDFPSFLDHHHQLFRYKNVPDKRTAHIRSVINLSFPYFPRTENCTDPIRFLSVVSVFSAYQSEYHHHIRLRCKNHRRITDVVIQGRIRTGVLNVVTHFRKL